jgi:hypothetical protein
VYERGGFTHSVINRISAKAVAQTQESTSGGACAVSRPSHHPPKCRQGAVIWQGSHYNFGALPYAGDRLGDARPEFPFAG